ncbi:TPA: hypothetical protein ACNH0U_002708 [Proteus mirabilis]
MQGTNWVNFEAEKPPVSHTELVIENKSGKKLLPDIYLVTVLVVILVFMITTTIQYVALSVLGGWHCQRVNDGITTCTND